MNQVTPKPSDLKDGADDRQTDKSTSPDTTTPDRQPSKTIGIVLMTLGAMACLAAGIGGLLIGFRFFTNP